MARFVYAEDGTLYLSRKKKNRKIGGNHKGVAAVITLPKLEAFKVSGVASGDVTGVEAGDFDLRVSGVAEVHIEGKCKSLDAKVSGVGELNARDFKCRDADVALSGVGEMSVYASNSVDVAASGVGEVNVFGNPEDVSKSKSFFTSVKVH